MIKHLIIVGLFSLASGFVFGQENKKDLTKASGPITKIEFQESTFAFGDLKDGETIKNVFVFTNTGNEPLVITNAKGSCGCTVPMFPKEPIMPGESADLLVEFNSKGKGKVGGSIQSKRVTITANTDPVHSYLTITGKVFKDEDSAVTKSKKKVSKKKASKEVPALASKNVDENKVSLFPNPTQGELNVDLKAYAGQQGNIEIYDISGIKIKTMEVDDFGQVKQFNVADYKPGIYTVSIKIDGMNRIAKRFVVPESE